MSTTNVFMEVYGKMLFLVEKHVIKSKYFSECFTSNAHNKMNTSIIRLFDHCIATWYAMSWSLVKLMDLGTSCGRG